MMKVLQVLPRLDYGGVERGTVEIAYALIQAGHKAYVSSAGGRLVPELEKMGAIHFRLPIGSKNPFVALSCIQPLKRFILKEGIEIAHARSRVPAWIAYLTTRSIPCHFLTTAHGYYRQHFFSHSMVLGDKIIAVSQPVADYLIQNFKVSPNKIVVIPRGIHLEEFRPPAEKEVLTLRETLKIPKNTFVIGMVGRISPIKGHPVLLKALHILQDRNFPAYVVIAGDAKDHPGYSKFLLNLVQKLNVGEFVRFTGFTENVPLILSVLDVVVVPSTVPEAFGRSALEAMALKKPVIASAHGGILDIVKPGETGLLFPPGDALSLAHALQEVLQNPEKCRRMGETGYQHALQHFTLEQFSGKTLQVYQSLLGSE